MNFLERIDDIVANHPNPDGYCDIDWAALQLALDLGIIEEEAGKPWAGKKWMFYCANPIGDGLNEILHQMIQIGILDGDRCDGVKRGAKLAELTRDE